MSFVSLLSVSSERRIVTLWLSNGGRPSSAGPATVEISLKDQELGTVTVSGQFEPYRFEVPPGLTAELETSEAPGRLRLLTSTWNPGEVLEVDDPRDLGVMVDRVTVD